MQILILLKKALLKMEFILLKASRKSSEWRQEILQRAPFRTSLGSSDIDRIQDCTEEFAYITVYMMEVHVYCVMCFLNYSFSYLISLYRKMNFFLIFLQWWKMFYNLYLVLYFAFLFKNSIRNRIVTNKGILPKQSIT